MNWRLETWAVKSVTSHGVFRQCRQLGETIT